LGCLPSRFQLSAKLDIGNLRIQTAATVGSPSYKRSGIRISHSYSHLAISSEPNNRYKSLLTESGHEILPQQYSIPFYNLSSTPKSLYFRVKIRNKGWSNHLFSLYYIEHLFLFQVLI
jgi:hypothetical protein